MASHVVAFVGVNANDQHAVESKNFMRGFEGDGISCHTLDLKDAEFTSQLQPLIEDGILFGWGPAGFGAGLNLNEVSFWDSFNIPFISVHADPPFSNPKNHHIPARNVVNGYHYQEGLDFQRDWIRSPQISARLPMGIVPIPERDALAWSKRPRRMVFVKTGNDPVAWRARWAEWPVKLRRVLEDASDALAKQKTGDIVPMTLECLEASGLNLQGRKDILFAALHEIDHYIRALRATTMVLAVRNLAVDIIGDGWGHVSHLEGRARFWPSVNSSVLNSLYPETQYLVNSNPNFSSGLHERVLRGFAAKCCVVSDNNAFSRTHLSHLPTYKGVEWNDDDLADRMAALYSDPSDYDDQLQPALDYVDVNNDPASLMTTLIELAEIVRRSGSFKGFVF